MTTQQLTAERSQLNDLLACRVLYTRLPDIPAIMSAQMLSQHGNQ